MVQITESSLAFLKNLSDNNNREWFNENKTTYKTHESNIKLFLQQVSEKLSITDDIEGFKMMRIYRDIRFSKDKTPYKPRFAASFKRSTERLRGSYYISLAPGNCVVGGGFYGPNSDDLNRIRKEFELDASEINEILNNKEFKTIFPDGMLGESLKTAPRGFDKNHKDINLIRKKQFYFIKSFSDKEVISENFQNEVNEVFVTLRPFFDFMSEVLTTNLNGESILED